MAQRSVEDERDQVSAQQPPKELITDEPVPDEPVPDEPVRSSPVGPRKVSSEELLQGQQELLILHSGEVYRLRHTRTGKLLLHK